MAEVSTNERESSSTKPGPASRLYRMFRWGIVFVAAFDLVQLVYHIHSARVVALEGGSQMHPGGLGFVLNVLTSLPASAGIALIGLVTLARFARTPSRLRYGVFTVVVLAVLSEVHAAASGSAFRHLYYSGLTLLGWCGGLWYARRVNQEGDQRYAYLGSLAFLAGSYFNAALSKVLTSGFVWANAQTVRTVLLAQEGGIDQSGWRAAYRSWILLHPEPALVSEILTLVGEFAAVFLLANRWVRALVAAVLFGMHLNIFVLTRIPYVEASFLLLLLGLPWREPATTAPLIVPSGRELRRVGATLLALVAIGLVVYEIEARGFLSGSSSRDGGSATTRLSGAVEEAGPLEVGDAVGGAEITALEASGGGLRIVLSGEPAVVFHLNCGDQPPGAFGWEGVELWHEAHPEPSRVGPIGTALHRQIGREIDDDDACDSLRGWLGIED